MNAISYRNLHFPSSIIQRAVWLYARFNLSLRDVEEIMAERGVEVSYETIRRWVKRLGPRSRGICDEGVRPKIASERAGHSSVATTLDFYSHAAENLQQEAAEKVDMAMRRALEGRN